MAQISLRIEDDVKKWQNRLVLILVCLYQQL